MRAINSLGPGLWSEPSEPLALTGSLPTPPLAISVHPLSASAAIVRLFGAIACCPLRAAVGSARCNRTLHRCVIGFSVVRV